VVSEPDRAFARDFEACRVAAFDHRAHLRLACVYLAEHGDVDAAVDAMRTSLLRFLDHAGVDRAKYHATLTRAWMLAVDRFLRASPAASADAFIDAHPFLLDARVMFTHYSPERLSSDEARARFVEPDLDPITR
jgi:hypothetical protein